MANLPTGTVTFLLTDIEGSTRLWESDADSMRLAMERHDAIADSVIREFGGILVKSRGEGDSLFAVFPVATDAVAAACALQSAFCRERWPEAANIRVRIALHTGDDGFRDGDYYGPAVNRCARLRAIAHGGQALVSAATHELVRDRLPARVSLAYAGNHRLKDLSRPEAVYQISHPDLPSDFPPLRSLDSPEHPNNLPLQVTSFVGRERQVAEVAAMFARTRLVTLTGSGGCGKTRLALQVAAELLDGLEGGAWHVELATLTDPNLVPQAVCSALGIKDAARDAMIEAIVNHVRSRKLLLLLDNCEHLLQASAELVDTLIRQCPSLLALATSREPLGIAGELAYPVPSLSLPDKGEATVRSVIGSESARLFVDRAVFHQPAFALTAQNADAVASICRRLDGIPLALELAAARARTMTVAEINERLDQRFRLLTGGSRTALPRQQTLRSLIDWSYDLLKETEKLLFCRLSVFAGGWTLDAAEAVCDGDGIDSWDVLDVLSSLADKSLVLSLESRGASRYQFLETVRQYSRERLAEQDDPEVWKQRHRAYFVDMVERAESKLTGGDQLAWHERLDENLDNLRAAFDSGMAAGDIDACLRLVAASWRFWHVRGHVSEAMSQTTAAVNAAKALGTVQGLGRAMKALGNHCVRLTEYRQAIQNYQEAIEIFRREDDVDSELVCLNNLAVVYAEIDRVPEARHIYERIIALHRERGDDEQLGRALGNAGLAARYDGDLDAAEPMLEESLRIARARGDLESETRQLANLGIVRAELGHLEPARSCLKEGLVVANRLGDHLGIAYALDSIANLYSDTGLDREAAMLWGAANSQRNRQGIPMELRELRDYETRSAASRGRLADAEFEACFEIGKAMNRDEALEVAMRIDGDVQ